jgi:hypothetical protein
METLQVYSLCSYLYLKLAKMPCFSCYPLVFFFYKIREEESRTGFPGGMGVRGGAVWHLWEKGAGRIKGKRMNIMQRMHTHVYKCKNDTC